MLNPGPISSGTLENNARRGTDFELIDDKRELSSEIPSPPEVDAFVGWVKTGASGSIDEPL
jgi:hypothetical protein